MGNISNYYLGEAIDDNEVASVQAAAEKIGIDVLNTRSVFLITHDITHAILTGYHRVVKNGPDDFTLLVASADTSQSVAVHEIEAHGSKKAKLTVQYGDFSEALAKVVVALKEVCITVVHSL